MNKKTLSIPEIETLAPSIFTIGKADHLTESYVQTPTIKVIEDLMDLGWEVVKVQEVKTKKNKGFQKHIVVFQHPDIMIKGQDGDDVAPQILLTNSHDGKNAFNFRVGLFRFICSNGLVISDKDFSNISIRHINYTFETLRENINQLISKLPGLIQKINLFKSIKLDENQILDFTQRAAKLRTKSQIDVDELLRVEREQDKGDDLWAVYNRVQEKLVNGTYRYGKKGRKARSIKNFQKDIELNEQLFEIASSFTN